METGKSFSLNFADRARLQVILRQRKADGLVLRRANALLLLDDGKSCASIAEFLYLDIETIRSWKRTFMKSGFGFLPLASYSRRQGYLDFAQEATLKAHLTACPPRTTDEVRHYIFHAYGQSFSRSGSIKLMARLGFTYKKPKALPLQASVDKQRQFIDSYNDLCNELLPDETIVFADAVHPEHQSRPAYGWFPKNCRPAIPATSGRKRLNIHGALNLETFKFQFVESTKINAETTQQLLQKIENAHPDKRRIHVFFDNARYHHAKVLQPWLKAPNRRVKLHFLPAYAPHLNPIERLWGVMHKDVTHNRYYAKFHDFVAAILQFFQKTLPDKWRIFRNTITDNFRIISTQNHKIIG